ncbi:uncharacterized protein [Leptinotarsa decemlineata]|uniref:uncharacterized protein n=1 Tax=Leptinotarsa decemlineata TaxID=7539 RepID=UPI003D30675A
MEKGSTISIFIMVAIFLVTHYSVSVTGIIAYDCSDERVNISTVSLRDVKKCPEPESTYLSDSISVKILQRNEIRHQCVRTCLIEVTRLMYHCGMHSHTSLVEGGLSSYVDRLGADECRLLHRYRTLKLYQQDIGRITMNGSTSATLTLLGSIDTTGTCEGAIYHEKGRTWKDVVILVDVRIQAREYMAKVNINENEISMQGGITCQFMRGYCFDTILGESVWDSNFPTTCDDHLSLLYEGTAELISNRLTSEKFIVVEGELKIIALMLTRKEMLCNIEAWQTEHPRIVVVERQAGRNIRPAMNILPENTDLMAYVNSKFLYVEQSYKRGLDKLYIDTIHRRCQVRREILRNRLLMAPLTPHAISQTLQEEGGHVGRVLGEVLYILRCVPKVATIRRTDRCYHELPVNVNNLSKFVAPITRVIQEYAEEIDCNGLTPPLYYLDDQWIGLSPYPTIKNAPREIAVDPEKPLQFAPIQPLSTRGLYTQEEISKVQRTLTFGMERKAVENILTRRIVGLKAEGQGLTTLNLFNANEMKQLAKSTMKQLWGWFSDVGMFMSGLIGFYYIFRVVKYTIGVTLNGVHLYQTIGCGISLLASLWNTLTWWIIQRERPREAQPDEPTTPLPIIAEPQQTAHHTTGGYPVLPQTHWTVNKDINEAA